MNDAPDSCQYNPRLDRYEHHFKDRDVDGKWVCTRCGAVMDSNGHPLALVLSAAGQFRGESRT
jgi:ABC-type ATPase with predicted acetyltransferase domain